MNKQTFAEFIAALTPYKIWMWGKNFPSSFFEKTYATRCEMCPVATYIRTHGYPHALTSGFSAYEYEGAPAVPTNKEVARMVGLLDQQSTRNNVNQVFLDLCK